MNECRICGNEMQKAFSGTLLRRIEVDYFHCKCCGYIGTEEPHWLDEAYGSAITDADTGILQRNIAISRRLASYLLVTGKVEEPCVDVAGGYGILTRLMRDIGVDYFWDDRYCANLFAKGCEATGVRGRFAVASAFEVLEHVYDPIAFVRQTLEQHGARTFVFSTLLYEGDRPPSPDWWYYAFEGGQHISFYQRRTLAKLAEQLGLNFVSANGIHVFGDAVPSKLMMHLATGRLSYVGAFIARRWTRRREKIAIQGVEATS